MVAELDKMLPEYYKVRGWDEKGWPTKKKLDELGLPS
jgi:aldehyde:ferredoxin oxidoreductase